jgi:soluble lytic murein transglycosylase-like protein
MKKFLLILLLSLLIPTVVFGATINININRTRELEDVYHPIIVEICEDNQVNVNLVKAIIRVESVYNTYAVSPKGARGLMQLTKGTAKKFGVGNVHDPYENIIGGVRYIIHLRSIFGEDMLRILASYYVGEGNVYKKKIPPNGKEYAAMVLLCKAKYDKRD